MTEEKSPEPVSFYSLLCEFKKELDDEKYKDTLTKKYILRLFEMLFAECRGNSKSFLVVKEQLIKLEKILNLIYDKCFPSAEPTKEDIDWAKSEIDKLE